MTECRLELASWIWCEWVMAYVEWEDELMCYAKEFYVVQYMCNMSNTFGIVRLEDHWCRVEVDANNDDIRFIPFCMCVSIFWGPNFDIVVVIEEIVHFVRFRLTKFRAWVIAIAQLSITWLWKSFLLCCSDMPFRRWVVRCLFSFPCDFNLY